MAGAARDTAEGDCAWEYSRSSLDQPGRAYAITASVTYAGGYEVLVGNDVVAGPIELGDVVRTSDPYYLAVEEAQAVNTDD